MAQNKSGFSVRGFLLHISHYDPAWCEVKEQEKPFDLNVGKLIVDEMAEAGMNMLIADCEDGVEYTSHPELKRHYTVPMNTLRELADYTKNRNIEFVPKLNFSQSRYHKHNHWMYPHNEWANGVELFDSKEYWKIGFEIIDELVAACRPQRFFHIGMDEDNDRSHRQFADAIIELHRGLSQRNLRTIIWMDTRQDPRGEVFSEKHRAVEDKIHRDIVRTVWDYHRVTDPEIISRLVGKGITVWGAPGHSKENVLQWKKTLLELGGNGMIMSDWCPCNKDYEQKHLELIKNIGPYYL